MKERETEIKIKLGTGRCSDVALVGFGTRAPTPATVFQPPESVLIHLKIFLFRSCGPFSHKGLNLFANTFILVLSNKRCLFETISSTWLRFCYNGTQKPLGELGSSRKKIRGWLAQPPGKIRFHCRSFSNGNALTKHSSDLKELRGHF